METFSSFSFEMMPSRFDVFIPKIYIYIYISRRTYSILTLTKHLVDLTALLIISACKNIYSHLIKKASPTKNIVQIKDYFYLFFICLLSFSNFLWFCYFQRLVSYVYTGCWSGSCGVLIVFSKTFLFPVGKI